MAVTTNTAGLPILTQIYALKDNKDCEALYDNWASTYDSDLADASQEYVAPVLVAKALVATGVNLNGAILDAGAGTGLVGAALKALGAQTIDGVDLSPGMLKVARQTGAYRNLETCDLSVPTKWADASYDALTCVGTLTHGHVGPSPALGEFIRVIKSGGAIVATVLDDIWISGGYKDEVERLRAAGLVRVESTDLIDYRKGAGVMARLVVLKKN